MELIIDRIEDDDEYVQIFTNYYMMKNDFPERILTDTNISSSPEFSEFLQENALKKVNIVTPSAGEGAKLLEIARNNAREKLTRALSYNDKKKAVLLELKELLGLENFPSVIEAYDISNTAGEENVCGMVVFLNGKPDKKNYKRICE